MAVLRPTAHAGELNGYGAALDGLWDGVLPTLAGLERLAADPDQLAFADLACFQYALHVSAEMAAGMAPPAGAEGTHAGLAEALEGARDATAVVAAAHAEGGPEAVAPLVWEWRGALFMVRLAESRLAGRSLAAYDDFEETDSFRRPLSFTTIILFTAVVALVFLVLSALPLAN